jgi:hypothetical protein
MNSRGFIFTLILAGFFSSAMAQDTVRYAMPKKKQHNILERMDFGGYLGAQFGDITLINISPLVGYRVLESFHVGLGFTYQFYKDNYYDYKSSAYGVNVYARYFVWRDLFAHAEYAPVYYDNVYTGTYYEGAWFHDVLLGGGYRQWIGNKAFMTLMILWNVNEQLYSPYQNPVIRIGFGAGI